MATMATTTDTRMPTSTASIPTTATTTTNDIYLAETAKPAANDDDDEQEESNKETAASNVIRICQQARSLWLSATRPEDLMQVEKWYRQVWEQQSNDEQDEQDSKKRRTLNAATATSTAAMTAGSVIMRSCAARQQEAGERLAMLLLQSGRTREADDILKRCLPCIKCRLSTQILAYSSTIQTFHHVNKNKYIHTGRKDTGDIPCRIYDNFLSMRELKFLQNVFADPSSSYWTCHDYAVEPPSPYFSHIIPLESDILEEDVGALGAIIRRIQTMLTTTSTTTAAHDEGEQHGDDKTTNSAHATTTTATKPFAPLAQRCTHVEMWAHNRPHATGHQLHFDSDNEGQGDRIRHPVVSCILYLSESSASTTTTSTSSSMSPPSLITNQRRVSHRAADKGWLIEPKLRRLAVFDGRVLHGVLPGQGVLSCASPPSSTTPPPRRITLMLAFWRHIQVRSAPSQQPPQPSLSSSLSSVDQAAAGDTTTPARRGGAAQPFPMNPKTNKSCALSQDGESDNIWAWQLRQPLPLPPPSPTGNDNASQGSSRPTLTGPIPLDHVYETLDGQPWTHKLGMPDYNEVFQGF